VSDNEICPHCGGSGFILVPGKGPPVQRLCPCALERDLIDNMERGMRRLSKQPPLIKKGSPLLKYKDDNLWITASKRWFLPNLRHLVLQQKPTWYFKVITDSDMMTAWLSSAALKGQEILDPDAMEEAVSFRYLTLVDLVEPPELLIIRLGIKAARNVAMPEVFLEALSHRSHVGKPVWVWDTSTQPLDRGHLCYSAQVEDFLSDFERVTQKQPGEAAPIKGMPSVPTRPTLSGNGR